jgi:hypothetical protein
LTNGRSTKGRSTNCRGTKKLNAFVRYTTIIRKTISWGKHCHSCRIGSLVDEFSFECHHGNVPIHIWRKNWRQMSAGYRLINSRIAGSCHHCENQVGGKFLSWWHDPKQSSQLSWRHI